MKFLNENEMNCRSRSKFFPFRLGRWKMISNWEESSSEDALKNPEWADGLLKKKKSLNFFGNWKEIFVGNWK